MESRDKMDALTHVQNALIELADVQGAELIGVLDLGHITSSKLDDAVKCLDEVAKALSD